MKKLTLALFLSLQAQAEILETPSLENCLDVASQATSNISKNDALFVFDIDNTVLALNQNLGSVQWFKWQQKLIHDKIEKDRIAESIDELLSQQGLLYALSKSHTPEASTSMELTRLQREGHPLLFHTSRSTDVRDVTERDLRAQKLLPLHKTIGKDNGFAGTFTFQSQAGTQRPVSFQNGVYMSVGQDKGVWLALLLEKTATSIKHLTFVDDELKNLQNVEREFSSKVPMTLCRYAKVDESVRQFNLSDKSIEVELWNSFQEVSLKFNNK